MIIINLIPSYPVVTWTRGGCGPGASNWEVGVVPWRWKRIIELCEWERLAEHVLCTFTISTQDSLGFI